MKEETRDDLTGLYTRRELYTLYRNIPIGSVVRFMFMDLIILRASMTSTVTTRVISSYYKYIKDKITRGNEKVEFPFLNNLTSADGKHTGHVIGQNITFSRGISNKWDALLFPGGGFRENVVELPASILSESSYTICMWLKPLRQTSWTSSFYVRYRGGFCTFSPFVSGGNSIFRISEDTDINGFHDALARQIFAGYLDICMCHL